MNGNRAAQFVYYLELINFFIYCISRLISCTLHFQDETPLSVVACTPHGGYRFVRLLHQQHSMVCCYDNNNASLSEIKRQNCELIENVTHHVIGSARHFLPTFFPKFYACASLSCKYYIVRMYKCNAIQYVIDTADVYSHVLMS